MSLFLVDLMCAFTCFAFSVRWSPFILSDSLEFDTFVHRFCHFQFLQALEQFIMLLYCASSSCNKILGDIPFYRKQVGKRIFLE